MTRGTANVGLWDSFLQWKVSSDLFHVTAEYFRPQISRENITAAFNVNSFEKAPSQNYVRQSVIGRGTGINLGLGVVALTGFYALEKVVDQYNQLEISFTTWMKCVR